MAEEHGGPTGPKKIKVNHEAWLANALQFLREKGQFLEFQDWCGGWPPPKCEAREWRTIETAPQDGTKVLVYYDHDASPYYDEATGKLTDYAAVCEGGDYLRDKGVTPAIWSDGYWDGNEMAGEPRYFVPGCWFAWFDDEGQYACFPTHWMPLPAPPQVTP